jgi:hypothetical protein
MELSDETGIEVRIVGSICSVGARANISSSRLLWSGKLQLLPNIRLLSVWRLLLGRVVM